MALWAIDYAISSDDAELLRQFDLASKEALDESAEWRMKYDEEVERAAKCDKELIQDRPKMGASVSSLDRRYTLICFMNCNENMALVERMEALKKELQATKLKCQSH
ncbi:hypothetical protein Tsubulata_000175 [Turnera subulata]|uniref:Uncharacterized protein n=1 Tax=Turnera subulata TaxID=218843 RepID=A0A9Q0GCS9_9ROSI|nr:hypothetical protein Tsubulata_000175 [Turnera subulata]